MSYKAIHVETWKCSECGTHVRAFNWHQQTCGPECARKRKTRLQFERRLAAYKAALEPWRRRSGRSPSTEKRKEL